MPLRRLLATAAVAALAFAATAPAPASAADLASANRAGRWVATQVSGGQLDDGFNPIGASADGLIGLASADDPALRPTIDTLLATVRKGAAGYVASGGGSAAGKLAIVAAAYDLDPRSFGGVDLVAALRDGVAADGSVGPYPGPFGSGIALAGLERAGASAPAALTTWLVAQQNADGGFGYAAGQASDADNTALAILGLRTDGSDAARAALGKAIAWARGAQNADGSWAGYVAVNSTCVLGSALLGAGAGDAPTKALAFARTKQLSSGAITDGSGANLMATTQCGPLLGGVSYLDVAWRPGQPSATHPTVTPTAPASAGASAATSPAPSPTGSGAGRGVPAHTGADDDGASLPLALGALGGLAALGASAAARRGR